METPSGTGSLWGAFANVASYGKDLTQDIRDIVSGVDLDPSDAKENTEEDEDLSAYVEDLERSLIRKKQEAEAAYKRIEDLEAQLAEKNDFESKAVEGQNNTEFYQKEVESIKKMNDEAILKLNEAHEAAMLVKSQEMILLQEECHRLRTLSKDKPENSAEELNQYTQLVSVSMQNLSKVLTTTDLESSMSDSTSVKLSKYIEIITSRLISFEVEVKSLKNTLHGFLLSQNERIATFSLPECKLKLEEFSQKRQQDQQRLTQQEASIVKLQKQLKEMNEAIQTSASDRTALVQELSATREKLEIAKVQSHGGAKKDSTIQQLKDQLAQLQRNNEHLSIELEATTNELQELQAIYATETASLAQEFQNKEESVMDRNNELERLVYTLTEELRQEKDLREAEKEQWTRHAEANTSSVSEAQWFELTSKLALFEADKNVAEQDADRLYKELRDLQQVLSQFQNDQATEEAKWKTIVEELRVKCHSLEEKLEEAVSRQGGADNAMVVQALAKKELECDRLREALERSVSRSRGEVDNIDKRMVIQMMIQYHESSNKSDVLEVIGRILGFTDEDKERMVAHPSRLKGIPLFGSIFRNDTTPSEEIDVAGKTLSDAWTDFLLKETK